MKRGVFLLYVDIGEKYPTKPPEAKFITPILHPNVMKASLLRNLHTNNLLLSFPPPFCSQLRTHFVLLQTNRPATQNKVLIFFYSKDLSATQSSAVTGMAVSVSIKPYSNCGAC